MEGNQQEGAWGQEGGLWSAGMRVCDRGSRQGYKKEEETISVDGEGAQMKQHIITSKTTVRQKTLPTRKPYRCEKLLLSCGLLGNLGRALHANPATKALLPPSGLFPS